MGCGSSSQVETKESKEITAQLRKDKKTVDSVVKLLLLGAGESGKSTIAKQMKILHKNGFQDEEKKTYISIIHNNVVSSMRNLIMACEQLGINIEPKEAAQRVLTQSEEYFSGPLEGQIAQDIVTLWKSDGIQNAFSQSSKFQLIDTAKYYFENMDRICAQGYVPTEEDVLRCRAKTTGIIELEFEIEGNKFLMVDVGGQRSERKKWLHCFENVTSVIFCVALSEYDLKLQEDDSTNRMQESLKLFKEICNSSWFTKTSMILFLNKKDLFEEKIKKTDLKVCFEDYQGGCNYDNAVAFIKTKFESQNEKGKYIYVSVTCATDTNNVKTVFSAVKDTILKGVLDEVGVL